MTIKSNVKLFLAFLLAITLSLPTKAQKENYNWLFGDFRGLTWLTTQSYTGTDVFGISGGDANLTGVPTMISSSIQTSEGCFSVSNSQGELLFYSDGRIVWNKNGVQMPNGAGLKGHSSSAQSGIVIPYPGRDTDKYIAFALGERAENNLSYSVIDMKLNGGLGDVAADEKNIMLTGASGTLGESMTAVRHPNKTDFWIIAVGREDPQDPVNDREGGNTYLNVWKIDQKGVHTQVYTVETTGLGNVTAYPGGYIRFNKEGDRFFFSNYSYFTAKFIYGTFDPSLGTFTSIKLKDRPRNPDTTAKMDGGYGVEFSPSGKYVYTTRINGDYNAVRESYLYIYDFEALLAAPSLNTINPLVTIKSPETGEGAQDGTNGHFGAVSLGPDNRMYVRDAYSNNMYVIPEPDNPANLKIYSLKALIGNAVAPSGGAGGFGLPTYTAFWFNVNLTIPVDTLAPPCEGVLALARLDISGGEGGGNFSSVKIDWGDGTALTENNSPQVGTSYNYTHTYTHAGTYTVNINCYDGSGILMPSLSTVKNVVVSTCKLPVNPHVRSWLRK